MKPFFSGLPLSLTWCHGLQRARPNTWLVLLWYLPSGRSRHLQDVPPSVKAVPIHHSDYRWEVQCLPLCLFLCLSHCVSYLTVSKDTFLMTPCWNAQHIMMALSLAVFRSGVTIINTWRMHPITQPRTIPPPLKVRAVSPPCGQLKVSEAAKLCALCSPVYRLSLCEKDCVLAGVLTEGQDGKYQ